MQADQSLVPSLSEGLELDRFTRRFDSERGFVVREPDINEAIQRSNQDCMQTPSLTADPITVLAWKKGAPCVDRCDVAGCPGPLHLTGTHRCLSFIDRLGGRFAVDPHIPADPQEVVSLPTRKNQSLAVSYPNEQLS